MKYLTLLFLVSCASNSPNCTVRQTGVILNTNFTVLECSRPINCKDDMDCQMRTSCTDRKTEDGTYICIERD